MAVLGAGGVGTATAGGTRRPGRHRRPDLRRRPRPIAPTLARLLRHRDHDVQVEVATSAEGRSTASTAWSTAPSSACPGTPAPPLDLRAVEGQRWIFDAIYSPIETPLMVRAASAGLARITGFDLFLGQAIDAFEIFTGHDLRPRIVTELETSLDPRTRARRVKPTGGLRGR